MFVEVKHMYKRYQMGDSTIVANNDINFSFNKGELVVIVGPSGAGKSTLLNIIGGMDTADEGEIIIDGKDIQKYNEKELTTYRRYDIGFVFQFYNLVQNLTCLENVELASQIVKDAIDPMQVLIDVGLEDRANNFPSQISGGEQQRVAIARAIAKNPKLLLCDEPTGALDYKTGKSILKLLQDTAKNLNTTVIIITHNGAIKDIADKVFELKDGTIVNSYVNENPENVENIEW